MEKFTLPGMYPTGVHGPLGPGPVIKYHSWYKFGFWTLVEDKLKPPVVGVGRMPNEASTGCCTTFAVRQSERKAKFGQPPAPRLVTCTMMVFWPGTRYGAILIGPLGVFHPLAGEVRLPAVWPLIQIREELSACHRTVPLTVVHGSVGS